MKTHSLNKKTLALTVTGVLFVFFGLGCAKEKKNEEAASPAPPIADVPLTPRDSAGDNRTSDWNAGGTANLAIDSLSAMNEYVMSHPVNNPQDIAISVKLTDVGSNQYTGRIFVSYIDNGQYYTGRFYVQNQIVPAGVSHGHTGKNHGVYNKWFSYTGATYIEPDDVKVRTVFHGFAQDQYGALMIIIDDSLNLGDGGGSSDLGGEIWFKNFPQSYAIQGQIPCWFIEQGPYDCRTFLTDGETVTTNSALYPTQSSYYTPTSYNPNIPAEPSRGWRRLGRFSGLSKLKAFQ